MTLCSNGHTCQPGDGFCQTCGVAITSDSAASSAAAPTASGAVPSPPGAVAAPAYVPPQRSTGMPGWAWALIGAGAVIVLGVGALVAVNLAKPQPQDITVTMDLYTGNFDACDIPLGYIDIPGAAMTLTADGTTVATGSLESFGADRGLYCQFSGTFYDVPTDAEFYSLELGRSTRGVITNSRSELELNDWGFSVSLGN